MSSPDDQLSDDCIRRAQRGDDAAFREIVDFHKQHVFACCYAITRNSADAGDAAQDAFIKFHRHIEQFDGHRPLKPYLMRIAANCSRDLLSMKNRRPEFSDDLVLEHAVGADTEVSLRMMRVEHYAFIREKIEQLPELMREVVSLFYFSKLQCSEIASAMDMNESAVKVSLHRARRKLQTELRDWRIS